MGEDEVEGDLPTHRARNNDRTIKTSSVKHGHRVCDGRPAVLALKRGLTKAAHVKRDASVTRTQSPHDIPPAPAIVDASVNQQNVDAACNTNFLIRKPRASGPREHRGSLSSPDRPTHKDACFVGHPAAAQRLLLRLMPHEKQQRQGTIPSTPVLDGQVRAPTGVRPCRTRP